MPLVATKITVSGGYFLLWALEEPLEVLLSLVPPTLDCTEFRAITHPQKKREWLASRLTLIGLCNRAGIPYAGIRKNTDGKPFLSDVHAEISVSHSLDFVAAALSFSGPVGIDLERPSEKMLRIASKYLTADELLIAGNNIRILCMYWSAKEAVFKWNGRAGVSFKHHISVAPLSEATQRVTARLHTETQCRVLEVRFYWPQPYCLAIAQEPTTPAPCP